MKTSNIQVKLRDGSMGAYLAVPEGPPKGAVIAIMEIWGVNDTMRMHAKEFSDAGFICLVPDLFWRQEPGVQLSDRNPEDVKKAFDLYYDFDYDLGVRDMEDTMAALSGAGLAAPQIGIPLRVVIFGIEANARYPDAWYNLGVAYVRRHFGAYEISSYLFFSPPSPRLLLLLLCTSSLNLH